MGGILRWKFWRSLFGFTTLMCITNDHKNNISKQTMIEKYLLYVLCMIHLQYAFLNGMELISDFLPLNTFTQITFPNFIAFLYKFFFCSPARGRSGTPKKNLLYPCVQQIIIKTKVIFTSYLYNGQHSALADLFM